MLDISIKILDNAKGLEIPAYATQGSAGMDLRAAIDADIIIKPGERVLIGCGFSLAIPYPFEGQIRSRSGLALKHGIMVLNSPGTIDSDYRGEIKVLLANFSDEDFTVERGMRIAQLVINKFERANLVVADHLDDTSRAQGGYGSTGIL